MGDEVTKTVSSWGKNMDGGFGIEEARDIAKQLGKDTKDLFIFEDGKYVFRDLSTAANDYVQTYFDALGNLGALTEDERAAIAEQINASLSDASFKQFTSSKRIKY